jgi:hypothetical protein
MILLLKTAPDGHGLPAGAIPMLRQPAPGEPTPAQVEAGNYPKRRVTWNGLAIRIENEAGTIRYGKGWQTRMLYPYGYIERSESADGDEVDVYLGPALDYAPTVFVVVQMRYGRWDEVDENKCMLGFMSEDDARTAYLKHYDDPRFLGGIIEMPVDEFVRKAKDTRERPGLIKAHVAAYTRADGTQVAEHDRHTRYAQLFKPSLGIKREDMPQVPSGVKQKFLEELRAAGISVEAKTVKPATLKPTQGTYNTENMDYLTQQVRSGDYDSKSPILVSQDDRVLDGHHRWAVAHLEGQDQPVVKIGLPIDKLLVTAKKFCAENGVESRGTTGGATIAKALGGDLVLFLKSRVGPYLRGGKLVNLSGYQGRAARAEPAPGQLQLFTVPPRPGRPNPYKDKDPVLDTPDLFTGKTPREESSQNPEKDSESNAKLIEKEQNTTVDETGAKVNHSVKELNADERNAIAKDQLLFAKYGNAGEGSRAAWKEAARGGRMDHLWPEHQANVRAAEEAEKAARRAKNDAWREKNLPRLQAEAARKRAAEEAQRLEEDRQREAQRQARERDQSAGGKQRIYLRVPFEQKDDAKRYGASWDAERRLWFFPGAELPAGLQRYMPKAAAPAPAAVAAPVAPPSQASLRDRLPTTGLVSENDPSIYGSWLLGYEGEPWSRVRNMAPPPRKQGSPIVLLPSAA